MQDKFKSYSLLSSPSTKAKNLCFPLSFKRCISSITLCIQTQHGFSAVFQFYAAKQKQSKTIPGHCAKNVYHPHISLNILLVGTLSFGFADILAECRLYKLLCFPASSFLTICVGSPSFCSTDKVGYQGLIHLQTVERRAVMCCSISNSYSFYRHVFKLNVHLYDMQRLKETQLCVLVYAHLVKAYTHTHTQSLCCHSSSCLLLWCPLLRALILFPSLVSSDPL